MSIIERFAQGVLDRFFGFDGNEAQRYLLDHPLPPRQCGVMQPGAAQHCTQPHGHGSWHENADAMWSNKPGAAAEEAAAPTSARASTPPSAGAGRPLDEHTSTILTGAANQLDAYLRIVTDVDNDCLLAEYLGQLIPECRTRAEELKREGD